MKLFIDAGGAIITMLDGMTNLFGSATMAAIPFVGAMSKLGNIGKKYALLPRERTSCRMMAA